MTRDASTSDIVMTRPDADRPEKRKRPKKRKRFVLLRQFILALIILVSVPVVMIAHWANEQIEQLDPVETAYMTRDLNLELLSSKGGVLGYRGVYQGRDVAFWEVPERLEQAVLAAEDRRFYEHDGVDIFGITRAAAKNVQAGEVREGGSTITQQLVKLLFLSDERTLKRKVQEAHLARQMEREVSKQEILTKYLNTVYFGAGAYGVDAAARRYFDKAVKDLTLHECAMLAGLIRSPSRYSLYTNPHLARHRAKQVLYAMARAGFITRVDAAEAARTPLTPRRRKQPHIEAGHFRDHAVREIDRMFTGRTGDLTVHTTIDRDFQDIAQKVVDEVMPESDDDTHAGEVGLVALRRDGAVLAMIGGRNYEESQFNRATQARRQPGSLFKAFVYLAAFDKGLRPNDLIYDAPITVDGWQPRNASNHYYGRLTLASAFAKSANSVAVRLQELIGRETVISAAQRLGLDTELEPYPSLALGTIETSLLDITGAFAAMAANQKGLQPYVIREVISGNNTLYRHKPPREEPAFQTPPRLIHHLLRSVTQYGTGIKAAQSESVYGKTGTSQNYRDAWFVGYTDDIVVGVWVGNDDDSPMERVGGGGLPAQIFSRFLEETKDLRSPLSPMQVVPEEPMLQLARTRDDLQAPLLALLPEEQRKPGRWIEDEWLDDSWLAGPPKVVTTSVLEVEGQRVVLRGVRGRGGIHAQNMQRYLGNKIVRCKIISPPYADCLQGDANLSFTVLFNGAGEATSDAPAHLVSAQETARQANRGIWNSADI